MFLAFVFHFVLLRVCFDPLLFLLNPDLQEHGAADVVSRRCRLADAAVSLWAVQMFL